jgi:glycosyltransferase involved in cell wall biosynthesis
VLACSDLYVSATMHEGFGLVYLEAMLMGLPVVTFAHGGQVDFLTDGVTGALLEPGDRSGLAEAVRSLAIDPERRRSIGRQNRVRAQQYTAERCGEAYERLFLKLTGRESDGVRAGGT